MSLQPKNALTATQIEKLMTYVKTHLRKTVRAHLRDKGQCWSFPYMALKEVGGEVPDAGPGDAINTWGETIPSNQLKKGDIIQISGAIRLKTTDGDTHHFSHHSMLVLAVTEDLIRGKAVKVAHQWVKQPVRIDEYRLPYSLNKLLFFRPRRKLD
jgi:hypothetical protein